MHTIGFQKSDLIKPRLSLRAANTTGMEVLGGVFVEIMVSQERNSISSRQLCYVTKGPLRQKPPEPPVYDRSLSTEQLKELMISHYSSSSFNLQAWR